jgi:hypothetical protein
MNDSMTTQSINTCYDDKDQENSTSLSNSTDHDDSHEEEPAEGDQSEYYCEEHDDHILLHDGYGGYYCEACDEEDDIYYKSDQQTNYSE